MLNINILSKSKLLVINYINCFCGLPKKIWEIFTIHFIAVTLAGTLYYLSYYFVNILKYNIKTAAFFISCYGFGSIVGGLLGGKLADFLNSRAISIISLFLEGLAFLFFLKVENAIGLMANMILFGVASYSFTTCNYIWVLNGCENNESQKLKSINILTIISNLGLGLATILLGIFQVINFNALFKCYALIFILLAGYLLLFTTNDNKYAVIRESKVITVKSYSNEILIYLMIFSLFFVGMIISQMSTTYSIYIHDHFPKYGLGGFSILFLINILLVVIAQAPIGVLLSGKNKVQFASYGALLVGVGMAILSFATFFSEVIVAIIIYTMGEIIFFSLSLLVCYENSPKEKRGQWTGVYRTIFAVSRVIGPAAGGLIYHHFNGKILWFCCSLVAGGVFIFCQLIQWRYSLLPTK